MNSTMDKEMSKMKTMTNLRTKLDQQRLAQTLIDDQKLSHTHYLSPRF